MVNMIRANILPISESQLNDKLLESMECVIHHPNVLSVKLYHRLCTGHNDCIMGEEAFLNTYFKPTSRPKPV